MFGEATPTRPVCSSLFRSAPAWRTAPRDGTRITNWPCRTPPGGWEGEKHSVAALGKTARSAPSKPQPHGAVFTALSRQPVPCRRTRRAKQRKRPRKVGKRRASQVGLDSHRADLPTRFTLFINLLRSASLISLFLNTLWFASCIVYFINYSFTYPSIFLCIFRDTFDLLFMYFSVVSN